MIVTKDTRKIDQVLKQALIEEGASEDSSIQTIYTISQDSDPLDLPSSEKGERKFEFKELVIYERVESIKDINKKRLAKRR